MFFYLSFKVHNNLLKGLLINPIMNQDVLQEIQKRLRNTIKNQEGLSIKELIQITLSEMVF